MLKRSTLALAVGLLATVLNPAPAAAACPETRINLPLRISIDRPYKQVDVPLVESCGAEYVASYVYGPQGMEDVLIYDPARNGALDYMDVYDWNLRPGSYYLRDGHAYDSSFDADYTVADDATAVKYGTYLGIATSRSGSTVTVKVSARRYAPDLDRMVPYSGRTVGLRQRSSSGAAWATKKYLTTNSRGDATVSFTASSTRQYQAWFGATPSFWEAWSAVSAR